MLLTQADSSQWPRVTLQAGLSLPLKLHAWFKRVPDFKKVLSAWIWWEEHKEPKCAPRLRQLQHLSASRQKTSQPQEEQSPHFVLRRTNTVPGKVPEIFTLVLCENGGGCLGVVLKEALPSLCFLPASPTGPVSPPQAVKSSLNTSLWPNPVKANNKLRIYVQKGHLAPGFGDRRAIQPRREHPTAAQEGRAARLKPQPGQSITHVLIGAEMFQNIWKRQCLPEVTRWIHTVK